MLYKWLQNVQFILYPPTCVLCQATKLQGIDICDACMGDLPRAQHACRQCASPLPSGNLDLCGSCQMNPPDFDATVAPFYYAPPISHLLARLKFQGKLVYARVLGSLAAEAIIESDIELPECVIPVPLHAKRLRERGFNQSQELARYIARRLDVPVVNGIVERTKNTRPQMKLDAKERRKNMRNAFRLKSANHWQHVAIVDDVMTTGNTVGELARTLKAAGVQHVDVWTVARTTIDAR